MRTTRRWTALLTTAAALLLSATPAAPQATSAARPPAPSARPITPAASAADGVTFPPDSAVQALLDARVRLLPDAGIVVGLIDARGRRLLSAGSLNGPGTPAPGERTVFEIGSVTKTFTATLLAEMVRRGEVRLDEPVQDLVPAGVRMPERAGKRITLLDVATQSSGLPRLPTNFAPADAMNPYADYTEAQLFSFLSSYALTRDPGAQYEYSNLAVGLLGLALARKAGTSYEQLVRDRIAGPLGMADTRIELTPDERARLAPAHDAAGDTVSNWDIPTLAGAGALRSTLHDMLRYLAANLKADTATVLGRAMRDAQLPRRPTSIPATRIGLIWMTRDTDGTRVVWHNGETGGYHAFVGFDPDRQVGVVILANSPAGADDIGLHLLDPRVPITPPPPPAPRRVAVQLTTAQLQRYVGRYQLAPGAVLTVTLRADALYGQLTGQGAFRLFAESDGHFFLKVVPATLDFQRDAQGRVTTAVLHQNGRDMPAPRLPEGS